MGYVAENTLPSIEKAIELGVNGVEIDVFRCASGELVVFHDKTLEKLTNATGYIEALGIDSIQKIEVNKRGKVRQSRIYYFKNLRGKKARIKEAQKES